MDRKRAEAKTWQATHRDAMAFAGGAGAAAAGSSSGAAASGAAVTAPKAKLPAKLSLASAREFKPMVPGCTLWYEPSTDRARISYQVGDRKSTHSAPIGDNATAACLAVLRWAWKQHVDCGQDPPIWKELRPPSS